MNERAHVIELLDGQHSMYFPTRIIKQLLAKYENTKGIFDKLTAMGRSEGQEFNADDLGEFMNLMAFGFLHEAPDMTGEKLEEITDASHWQKLGTLFGLAFSGALPDQGDSENPKKARR